MSFLAWETTSTLNVNFDSKIPKWWRQVYFWSNFGGATIRTA